MANELFQHEHAYRGDELQAKLREFQITICGVGAVGSTLAENLARQGFDNLRAIDDDRVEQHNIGTQAYQLADVGGWKVDALRNRLFQVCNVEIDARRKRMEERSIKQLLKGSQIVVDAFDNSASRGLLKQYCLEHGIQCLHVGLFEDYCEVIWNDQYRIPADVAGDVCDYPLARNLVILAIAIASESLVGFIANGQTRNLTATLGDFAVREIEANR